MTVVLVAAERREFAGLLRRLPPRPRKLSWGLAFAVESSINGHPIVLVANGPGPRLAAAAVGAAVSHIPDLEGIVSTGFCGGLVDELAPGTIFAATEVNGRPVEALPAPCLRGPLVSQDRVAVSAGDKRALRERGVMAVEMEAAGVMDAAARAHVPFYCVRVVTDGPQDELPIDFNTMRSEDGRFDTAKILASAGKNPLHHLPALLRLNKTCREAAERLGEFLAGCRF